MRRARIAFLGIAGLAVLAGLAFLAVRLAGREVVIGRSGAGALRALRLLPGLGLEGRVLDGDVPVAGATVLITSDEDGDAFSSARCPNEEDRSILDCPCAAVPDLAAWRFAEGRGEAEPIIETTTEKDGTFAVTGLSPGRYAVWAAAGALAAVALDVEAGGGAAELVLSQGVWYSGTVRDGEGAAIEGALVAAVYAAHSRFFAAQTDGGGGFLLGPLPEGRWVVLAYADGRVPVLDAEPSGDMELALVPAARVEGMVVRGGEPIAGAEVRTQLSCSPLVATTDEKGRFTLDRLLPERATIAAFSGEDGGSEQVDLIAEDAEGLVIALRRGGAITGEVRDEGGTPVAGARIAIEGKDVQTAVVSNEDGRFRASGLPPDRYALWLFPPAGLVAPGRRSIAVAQGGETRTSYRLLRAARLAGVVQDEEGWPLPGASIQARRAREGAPPPGDWDPQAEVETRTDRRGRFTLEQTAPGPVHVWVDADGFLPAELDARAPGELAVTLRRGGSLEVAVVDEEDAGVPGARLRVTSARPQAGEAVRREAGADARGWYRFDGLPRGRYRVVAQLRSPGESERRWSRTVAAEASVDVGETAELTLRLEAGLSIAGKVVEEGSGRPLAGVEVEAADELDDSAADTGDGRPPRAGGVAITDREGRFEIRHLRPNRHRLDWTLDEYQASELARPTRPGETGLVLTMRRLVQVTGRVLGEDGKPLERFTVGTQPFHAADGRFALRLARTGRETLRVQADGFAPLSKEVAIDGRQDRDVGDLRLSRAEPATPPDEGGAIEGTVRDAAGEPLRDVRVTVGAPVARESVTDADGRFALEGLPAGEYTVELHEGVAGGNAGLAPRRVEVTENGTVRVDFQESAEPIAR